MQNQDPVHIAYQKLIEERDRLAAEARTHESSGEAGERNHKLDLIDRLAPKLHQAEALLNAGDKLTQAREALENIKADHDSQHREKSELQDRLQTLEQRGQQLEAKLAAAQEASAEALAKGETSPAPEWAASAAYEIGTIARAVVALKTRIQVIDTETESFLERLAKARTHYTQAAANATEAEAIRALAPVRQTILTALVSRQRSNPSAPAEWPVTFLHGELEAERAKQQQALLAMA